LEQGPKEANLPLFSYGKQSITVSCFYSRPFFFYTHADVAILLLICFTNAQDEILVPR